LEANSSGLVVGLIMLVSKLGDWGSGVVEGIWRIDAKWGMRVGYLKTEGFRLTRLAKILQLSTAHLCLFFVLLLSIA